MLFSAQECFGLGTHVLRVVIYDCRKSDTEIRWVLIRPNAPNAQRSAYGVRQFLLSLNALAEIGYSEELPPATLEIKAWLCDRFLT